VVLVVGGCCRAGVVWAGDCLQFVDVVVLVLVSKVSQQRAALVAGGVVGLLARLVVTVVAFSQSVGQPFNRIF